MSGDVYGVPADWPSNSMTVPTNPGLGRGYIWQWNLLTHHISRSMNTGSMQKHFGELPPTLPLVKQGFVEMLYMEN